ncbi:short-subunit dehydrogenase [Bradyrhizobium sp. LM3.6]
MTPIRGAAAITGAACGIGRALAIELARRGCDLALADRDEAGLKTLAAEIGAACKVSLHRVDVGEPDDIARFASEATTTHPALGIVVNNAGVALMGSFEEIDQAQMDWLFDINFWGVVHGTRAFLPHLKTMGEAHIVNLSSIFGIIAPPGQSAYAAAKFAVRGFSESVRHELAMAGSPVRLSVVHPGGVATAIARNSRTGVGVTDNARRSQSIERFENAAKTTPTDAALRDHQGHREKRAAYPDRQRRPLHGSVAALPSGDVLGAVAAQAGEDGEGELAAWSAASLSTSSRRRRRDITPLTAPPADRQNTRSSCDRSPPCSIRASPRNLRCLRRRAGPF